MPSTKLVTVYGATGQQGGSVINSLLGNKSGEFAIRAITRNPESDKSIALVSRGVEVVKGDGFHKDQMVAAFKGSWATFVNTNSSDPLFNEPSGMTEQELGKIIVDAAFEAGVQHFIYSGLTSAKLATNGEVPSITFDEKHAIGEYAKSKGFKSVVIVAAGWYMENHIVAEFAEVMGGFPLTPDAEGYLTLKIPRMGGNDEIPFIAIEADYGDLVHGVLLQPETYNGQLIQAASEMATPDKLVEEFQKLTGKKSRYVAMEDWRAIESYGNPDIEALKTMYGFNQYVDGKYFGVPANLGPTKELKAKAIAAKGLSTEDHPLWTLEKFLKNHFSV